DAVEADGDSDQRADESERFAKPGGVRQVARGAGRRDEAGDKYGRNDIADIRPVAFKDEPREARSRGRDECGGPASVEDYEAGGHASHVPNQTRPATGQMAEMTMPTMTAAPPAAILVFTKKPN